ncbi:hypothetical protein ABPG72_017795 [Tetrahymena utriculariae]
MKQVKLQYISQGHYNLFVDCSDIESSILLIKEKLQVIKRLTLSFKRILTDSNLKLETMGPDIKKLVPIISQIEELGLVIDVDNHDQNLFNFIGLIKRIHHLTLDIRKATSAELALSLLKSIPLENLSTFQLDLFRVSTNNKNFHKNLLLIVFEMKNIQQFSLSFDSKEDFPEQNELVFPQLINDLYIKGEGIAINYYMQSFRQIHTLEICQNWDNHYHRYSPNLFQKIESLKNLTIPNLNFVKLNKLIDLQELKITREITENIQFQDFCYLSNLKKFNIAHQIHEEAKFLNRIKYLPQGCVVHLSTYYLGYLQYFGQSHDIFLHIDNYGCIAQYEKNMEEIFQNLMCVSQQKNLASLNLRLCHAEKYLCDNQLKSIAINVSFCSNLINLGLYFYQKHIREACNLTPIIERNLALNTDINFFDTDFKISDHFKNYISQRSISILKLIAYRKLISPSLLTNPSMCYFDLNE